jgi:SWI/SNF related-matrix-associated actin-dependent regulator of chromatin subfamily C
MFSSDFVRFDHEAFKHASAEADDWSDQETLLLLEGIEMFDDDWVKVAEHVQTRSKDQCVLRFLQMPIEDPYLAQPGAELGPLRHQAGLNGLPFETTDNPVMSVVAFLAGAVGPGVAAAAAQSALGELTDGLRKAAPSDGEAPDGETNGHEESKPSLPRSHVERAASVALGSAAAKAAKLATHEQRRLSALTNRLMHAQLKKLELKIGLFEKLEDVLDGEKRKVELDRQALYRERLNVQNELAKVQKLLEEAKTGGAKQADVDAVRNQLAPTVAASVLPAQPQAPPPQPEGEQVAMQQL